MAKQKRTSFQTKISHQVKTKRKQFTSMIIVTKLKLNTPELESLSMKYQLNRGKRNRGSKRIPKSIQKLASQKREILQADTTDNYIALPEIT